MWLHRDRGKISVEMIRRNDIMVESLSPRHLADVMRQARGEGDGRVHQPRKVEGRRGRASSSRGAGVQLAVDGAEPAHGVRARICRGHRHRIVRLGRPPRSVAPSARARQRIT